MNDDGSQWVNIDPNVTYTLCDYLHTCKIIYCQCHGLSNFHQYVNFTQFDKSRHIIYNDFHYINNDKT